MSGGFLMGETHLEFSQVKTAYTLALLGRPVRNRYRWGFERGLFREKAAGSFAAGKRRRARVVAALGARAAESGPPIAAYMENTTAVNIQI